MAKPIATPATVFAACERLDAANERWNRDDVRRVVGGGGYVVIDPLIRAWRDLKPLREVAPSTPAELLHQVATSLEAHLKAFTAETHQRVTAQQQVFEATVADLAERLAGLEEQLEDTTARLASAEAANGHLNVALTERDTELTEARKAISHLTVENDSLKGQIARQDKAHAVAIENLQGELRSQAQQHERAGARWREAQAAALAAQRQELIATAEQAENRWMKLLDEARQETRTTLAVSTQKLDQAAAALQREREEATALKSRVGALETDNTTLEQALARQIEDSQRMKAELEQNQQQAAALAREFADYKEAYRLGSELGSLKDAVEALQQQMGKREKKPRKPAP